MAYSKALTINTSYRMVILVTTIFFLVLNLLIFYASYNQKLIIQSENKRYASMHIAYELLQSSNEPTQMARLYALTGNAIYKHYFDDILAIRAGKLPRPKNYSPYYWDYVLAGIQPHEITGELSSFTSRIKQLNFSDTEMDWLNKALQRANYLTELDQKFFNSGQNLSPTTQGDLNTSRDLLQNKEYWMAKALLMQPIEKFQQAVELRTAKNFSTLQTIQQYILYIFQGIILLALLICIIAYRYLDRRVVKPIGELHEQAERVTQGDYSVRNHIAVKNELEMLGVTFNKMCNFIEKDTYENGLLNKMNEMLHTCQNADEAYSIIYLTAKKLFPLLSGGLAIYNNSTHTLETVRQWGEHQILKPSFIPSECWALRNGNVYVVDDPDNAIHCQHYTSPPNGSYINLPLTVRGETIGLLDLNCAPGKTITEKQLQLAINFFSISIKLALADIKLRETLRFQAIRDGLTGLFNRRYLDETLPRELEQMKRKKTSLSIAMLDIDFFKKFNDQYGHDAGDEVLKFIGKSFLDMIRAGDIACRYGGEELVIILIDANIENARHRIEHICQTIKNATLNFQGQSLPQITLSAGIATAPMHADNADDLLNACDTALYAAKKAGRDCIVLYTEKNDKP